MRTRRTMRRSVWFWLFLAVILVLLLGILFGGYRRGTPVDSLGVPAATAISLAHNSSPTWPSASRRSC